MLSGEWIAVGQNLICEPNILRLSLKPCHLLQENAKPTEDFYQVNFTLESKAGSRKEEKYLIGQALGGGEISRRAAEASTAFGVPVRPFAGVAARLSSAEEGISPLLSNTSPKESPNC